MNQIRSEDFHKFRGTKEIFKNISTEWTVLNCPKGLGSKNFTKQIAFNVIPHIDSFMEDGYTKEEWKMTAETKKILDLQNCL